MIEMNTPKVVGCLLCGFRTENVLEIETFQEFGCPNCNKQMKSKGLTPERLEKIKKILTEQKEKDAQNG